MKMESYRDKTEFYTKVLLAVVVLFGALIFLRIVGFVSASSEAQAMASKADPNEQGPNEVSKLLASAKASAEELKKKNLFVLATPKQHPVREVLGILGDEALINGEWRKAGDSVGDAKILAIEPTSVRVAWDGQEKEFSPIGASGGSGPSGKPEPVRPGRKPGPPGQAQMVVTGARAGHPGSGPSQLSEEERNRRREQLQNMSPEERQRAREEMRQRLGARGR